MGKLLIIILILFRCLLVKQLLLLYLWLSLIQNFINFISSNIILISLYRYLTSRTFGSTLQFRLILRILKLQLRRRFRWIQSSLLLKLWIIYIIIIYRHILLLIIWLILKKFCKSIRRTIRTLLKWLKIVIILFKRRRLLERLKIGILRTILNPLSLLILLLLILILTLIRFCL